MLLGRATYLRSAYIECQWKAMPGASTEARPSRDQPIKLTITGRVEEHSTVSELRAKAEKELWDQTLGSDVLLEPGVVLRHFEGTVHVCRSMQKSLLSDFARFRKLCRGSKQPLLKPP